MALRLVGIGPGQRHSASKRLSPAILFSLLIQAGTAQAATQGEIGAHSIGSIGIVVSVANRTQITGLRDLSLISVDPGTPASRSESLCIWSNTPTRAYSVTASGSGPADSFAVANGAATTPYSVAWANSGDQSSGTLLTSGIAYAGQNTSAEQPACISGPASTASLILSFASADLQAMQPEVSYTGSLNLLVTPQ